MIQQADFDGIVAAFQRAALEDGHWLEATKLADGHCGAFGSQIATIVAGDLIVDVESDFGRLYSRGEVWEEPERLYAGEYWAADPRGRRLLGGTYGRLMTNRELFTEQERKTSPVLNEFFPTCGTGQQFLVRLDGGPELDVVWVLSRHRTDGEWETESRRLIERLSPHLTHAVAVRQELRAARLLGETLEEMLAAGSAGIVYLDRAGAIVGSNDAAERTLRSPGGLFDRCGQLRARHPDDDARLGEILNGALRRHAAGAPTGGFVAIRRRPCELPLSVHILPVNRGRAAFGSGRAAVLVLIVDPRTKPRTDPRQTAELLGLTQAEGTVVARLAEGMSIRQIVDASGRTENTVRSQVKQALAKTGCSRQAELVRLALLVQRPSAGSESSDSR